MEATSKSNPLYESDDDGDDDASNPNSYPAARSTAPLDTISDTFPVPAVPVQWTYLGDRGTPIEYSASDTALLEAGWQQHQPEVNLAAGRYAVDFSSMAQRNVKTGYTRAVTRVGGPNHPPIHSGAGSGGGVGGGVGGGWGGGGGGARGPAPPAPPRTRPVRQPASVAGSHVWQYWDGGLGWVSYAHHDAALLDRYSFPTPLYSLFHMRVASTSTAGDLTV
jgi:hypothetical protein